MTIRDVLTRTPAVGIAIVVALLLAAVILLASGGGQETAQETIWYFDLTTAEKVPAPPTLDGAPVKLPTKNIGVVARVFTCGTCATDTFIGHIEKPNPNPPPHDPNKPFSNTANLLVAKVPADGGDPSWHAASSPEGAAVLALPQERCGQTYRECFP